RLVEDGLQDDAGGDADQEVVGTDADPLGAARRGRQAIGAVVGDDVLPAAIEGGHALALGPAHRVVAAVVGAGMAPPVAVRAARAVPRGAAVVPGVSMAMAAAMGRVGEGWRAGRQTGGGDQRCNETVF